MLHPYSRSASVIAGLLLVFLSPATAGAGFVLSRTTSDSRLESAYYGEGGGSPLVTAVGQGSGLQAVFASAGGVTLAGPPGGSSSVSAVVQGSTFSWGVFNASGGQNGGSATLTVATNEGTFTFDSSSRAFALDAGGNFFQLTADGKTRISGVTISFTPFAEPTDAEAPDSAGDGNTRNGPSGEDLPASGPFGGGPSVGDVPGSDLSGGGARGGENLTATNPAPPGVLLGLAGLLSLGAYAGLRGRRVARRP